VRSSVIVLRLSHWSCPSCCFYLLPRRQRGVAGMCLPERLPSVRCLPPLPKSSRRLPPPPPFASIINALRCLTTPVSSPLGLFGPFSRILRDRSSFSSQLDINLATISESTSADSEACKRRTLKSNWTTAEDASTKNHAASKGYQDGEDP
jgi:hypothetical protein